MNTSSLTDSQRIQICSHIAPMIRSGLPFERGLKAIASELPSVLSSTASHVQSRLQNGESLQDIIANGSRPTERSLKASIAAGEASNELATAIEGWASIQIAMAQATKRYRLRMIYPVILIFIAVGSVGWSIHSLVPTYKSNLEDLHIAFPKWFYAIEFISDRWIQWSMLAASLCVSPLIYFLWRHSTYDANGWPHDLARQWRLQSHAAAIAKSLIHAETPSQLTKELAIASLGAKNGAELLAPACRSVLDLMEQGALDSTKGTAMLEEISQHLKQRSDNQIEAQGRWVATIVTFVVAMVVGISYVLIVYLPWLYLLHELKRFRLSD
jgi:type II secretory pathway component PulF